MVNLIITDLCVFEVKEGGGLVLTELHPGVTVEHPGKDRRAVRGRAEALIRDGAEPSSARKKCAPA